MKQISKDILRHRNKLKIATFSLVIAVLGASVLPITRANTNPWVSFEAETGTLLNSATTGTDADASGGKYVEFSSVAITSPTSMSRPSKWNKNLAFYLQRRIRHAGSTIARFYKSAAAFIASGSDTFATPTVFAQSAPLSFVFASGGDIGANSTTATTFAALDKTGAKFFLALGDMDYDQTSSDAAFCDYVKAKLPVLFSNPSYPFQIVSGNHESQGGPDGYILNHAACLPDRMNSKGTYPAQYYFDYPATDPLMRVIMISPDLLINNIKYDYANGTSFTTWLTTAIDQARASGIPWVTVGMHKNCITAGVKTCEIKPDLINLLVSKKVDLILQGHEHNYQRTKQLAINSSTCTALSDSTYNASCVVTNPEPNKYAKGSGSIILINGTIGRSGGSGYAISTSDPSYPYMVKAVSTSSQRGFSKWTVSRDSIDAQYVSTAGSLTDSFAIVGATPPPPVDTTPPTVNLTNPVAGQTVAGQAVGMTASASDNVAVSKVEFFVNGTLVGSDNSSPYSVTWNSTSIANGSYKVQAKAYDSSGNTTVSSLATVTVSNGCQMIPSAAFGKVESTVNVPSTNAYRLWVRIMASNSTNNSTGISVGPTCPVIMGNSDTIVPNTWTWVNYSEGDPAKAAVLNLAAGNQSLTLYGNEARVRVDRVLLLLDPNCIPSNNGDNCAAVPDTTQPTLTIASPDNNENVSGQVDVAVSASDNSPGGVGKVEFYVDNSLFNTDITAPFSASFDSSVYKPGVHIVKAIAYDGAGNTGSAQVTVNIEDIKAPVVIIKAPDANAQVSGTFAISTSGFDLGTLTLAEFLIDGQMLESITGAGPDFMANFNTRLYENGPHTITVQIYDNAQNKGIASIPISVFNDKTPPTAPTNVHALVLNSGQVQVDWSAATDNVGVVGYYVQRNGVVVGTVGNGAYTDSGLTAATTYTYTVVAYDAAGLSSIPSSPASVTTPAVTDTTAPSVPGNVSGSVISGTQVNLSWSASTDTGGSGVAGYRVIRSGQQIASITTTSFLDGTVSPSTTYQYSVVAYDGAGNASAASTSVTITTSAAGGQTVILPKKNPIADSYILGGTPTYNYGTKASLRLDKDGPENSLMKFVIDDIDGRQVVSAKLRLYCTNSGPGGGSIWAAGNNWDEKTVTFQNSPAATNLVASIGKSTSGQWIEVDVSTLINAEGTYTMRFTSSNSDGMDYASREATNKPQLIITVK